MQKCAKKQLYFFTIAFLITFCCVLINKLSFYTDCPKIPELVKQCFSNLSMSKCLIVSALSSAFPNDFPIFAILSSGKFGFFACKRKYVVDCS